MSTLMLPQPEALLRFAEGGQASAELIQTLEVAERDLQNQVEVFGIKDKITSDTSPDLGLNLESRLGLLQSKYAAFCRVCGDRDLIPEALLPTLWWVWLPLAQRLMARRQQLGRPLIQGLLGMQGAGKTTLGLVLEALLAPDYRLLSFSIDDLYKPWAERQQLRQQDPRLIWRGPPGTHDVALGIELLQQARRGEVLSVPVFDKALAGGQGDRITPRQLEAVDIVLFDGWFLGVRPLDAQRFAPGEPLPAPLLSEADRQFASDCNARLAEYLPLWDELDGLWLLGLSEFELSRRWRLEAEQRLRAEGRGGMTDGEVIAFVDYFWKALHPQLFVSPLMQPGGADLVIEIGEGHQVQRVYGP